MKYLIYLLLLITLSGCQAQTPRIKSVASADISTAANTSRLPADSSRYFPLGVFQDDESYPDEDSFLNTWYSSQLFAMKEPVIYDDATGNEIYRFTWLRTFHHPVAIRIEQHKDTYLLFWKVCSGAGGYKPGKLVADKKKTIDKTTWTEFKNRLAEAGFWNLSTHENGLTGTDGAQWILEGKSPGQYHVVDRWTPQNTSKYYQCCDFLIGLTDLGINGQDKY